jgi:signal transduction histidine kinase
VTRIEKSVQTILNLQSNLRAYLSNHQAQKESFYLKTLLQVRVELLESSYKNIKFFIEIPANIQIETNREAFVRVIDNILSNASKYNKKNGSVTLRYKNAILEIEDTGKGIKNPKKVFQRFYKEQERGIGIGLHIVQKLCDELGIALSLSSQLGVGTLLKLSLKNIIQLENSNAL